MDTQPDPFKKDEKVAKKLLLLGLAIVFVFPWLISKLYISDIFDLSKTGQIEDTIGGITSPFLNLIGAYLIFLAFKAQIEANRQVQNQYTDTRFRLEEEVIERKDEIVRRNLYRLFDYLVSSIDKIEYPVTQSVVAHQRVMKIFKGTDAIHRVLGELYTLGHQGDKVVSDTVAIVQVQSSLELLDELLTILLSDNVPDTDEHYLILMCRNVFLTNFAPQITGVTDQTLKNGLHCKLCGTIHAPPEGFYNLINSITNKLDDFIEISRS